MATWPDPTGAHTPTTGQAAPAAWGNKVNAAVDFLRSAPSAGVYNSAALSIATGALTALTFNSERWDNDSIHSTASNTSRLTCVTAGLYVVECHIVWADAHADGRQLDLRVNGATVIRVVNNAETHQSVVRSWKMAAGDYVEAYVTQSSGATKTIQAASAYTPEFAMTWVSAG